jgi:hypothetical protein
VKQVTTYATKHPVVGGIYRDGSDRSLVVLTVVGTRAVLEYADGSIAGIDIKDWRRFHLQPAVF